MRSLNLKEQMNIRGGYDAARCSEVQAYGQKLVDMGNDATKEQWDTFESDFKKYC